MLVGYARFLTISSVPLVLILLGIALSEAGAWRTVSEKAPQNA